jgi:hypothetical protein
MRPLLFLFMSACSVDYSMWMLDEIQMEFDCSFESVEEWGGEEILVCARKSSWMEAESVCENLGGELLSSPGWFDAQSEIAEIGERLIGERWYVGWPEYYDCPSMSKWGGSSPRYDCERLEGFMCSF